MKPLNLIVNFLFALLVAVVVVPEHSLEVAAGITLAGSSLGSLVPQGVLPMALQTEVWVRDIKENPVPDHSFVLASTDLSEYVDNNKLHLAEAGAEPLTVENWFQNETDPLGTATITDADNEVVLKTYSTQQTRHRQLEDVEVNYDRRQSIINRHRISLEKNLGARAAFEWTPGTDNAYNKVLPLVDGSTTISVIDAIIDMQLFFAGHDKTDGLNVCLSPEHMAAIRKEDKDLYKSIMAEKGLDLYGFKVHTYSRNPIFDSTNAKKAFGSVMSEGDKRCSFFWATDEVFRCFGSVEMFATLRDSAWQADIISFAQRALVGKIRSASPKYTGAII